MKGPGIRLDLDVRREWKCPQCGKQRRLTGDTVSVRCRCTRDGTNMQLIESRRQTRSFADVIERVQQASANKESSRQKQSESNDQREDNQVAASPDQHNDQEAAKSPTETDLPAGGGEIAAERQEETGS